MLGEAAILSVRELTEQLRRLLEVKFPFVWVRGEISNLSRPGSGHIYFSLKDQDAQLQCVWFKQKQQIARQGVDPLTGEVREPGTPSPLDMLQNGLDVLCAGRITLYAARGQYQLAVELLQPAGEGMLARAFEAARRKLAAQGYFSLERKRPLPVDPLRVALITSPSGAAIHDFLELGDVYKRQARIRLFPVVVQGEGATSSLVRALEEANAQQWAQVVVIIRGGGSLEDLWAFNEEPVARAVFSSRLPVLAGIGHEVDVTLTDMTADVRAATPSHAAQLLWPPRAELMQRVDSAETALRRGIQRCLDMAFETLGHQESALRWLSPLKHQARLAEQLVLLQRALERAVRQWIDRKEILFRRLETSRRGAFGLARLDVLSGRLGIMCARLEATMPTLLHARQRELATAQERLGAAARNWMLGWERQLEKLALQLAAGDPMMPLRRGYALARTGGGNVLRSVHGLNVGNVVEVLLADGILETVVSHVRSEPLRPGE